MDISTDETELCSDMNAEQAETTTRMLASSAEAVGVWQEQSFIILSEEEFGEHYSSITYCRILFLACSPSGASFVSSAAAQSSISHLGFSAVSSGGKKMNQVPGKLLVWDTEMMKQQECSVLLVHPSDLWQHECTMSWKAHDGEVFSVEFSCDKNTVYSIDKDEKLNSE